MKNEIYKIRFNTDSKTDKLCWRVIDSKWDETLVDEVHILTPCYTTKDWLEEINDYKYHITCEGKLYISNNHAFIV